MTKLVALDPKRSKEFKPFPKASAGVGVRPVVRVQDHTLENTSLDACNISLIGELSAWIQCHSAVLDINAITITFRTQLGSLFVSQSIPTYTLATLVPSTNCLQYLHTIGAGEGRLACEKGWAF